MDIKPLKTATAVENIVFPFVTLTPLFMHGANNKAEARPSSFKGVIRYWWRTLQEENTFTVLLEKEKVLFGGAAGNDAGVRSPFRLQFRQGVTNPTIKMSVTPHSGGKGYSTCIPQGQRLELMMTFHTKNKDKAKQVALYLEYTLLLAGFGQRSRRGAGAIQYESYQWSNLQDMKASLKSILSQLEMDKHYTFHPEEPNCLLRRKSSSAPFRHPVLTSIWAGSPFPDAEEARKVISKAGHYANPSERKQWLGSANPRMASPLLTTVRKIGNQYVPIITEVSSKYLNHWDYRQARSEFLACVGVKIGVS